MRARPAATRISGLRSTEGSPARWRTRLLISLPRLSPARLTGSTIAKRSTPSRCWMRWRSRRAVDSRSRCCDETTGSGPTPQPQGTLLMTAPAALPQLTAASTNDRATPSLVYRSLLRSIKDGLMVPGAKLPNERELAQQLNTSRTAVRSALAMMERQGLVLRRVGSGTYLTDNADLVFDRMDQTNIA